MKQHLAESVLSAREFEQLADLAYRSCGINLKNGKRELVQARLGKRIRDENLGSFSEYYERVIADSTGEELIRLLDALTTNFTSFLREPSHFHLLRKTILPAIPGQIRIWSAACSSGEEPYSIAFSLLEEMGTAASGRIHITASDISSRALETARGGAYEAERFRDVPAEWLSRYLLRGTDRRSGWFRVKPAVRNLVTFQRINLIEPFSHTRPFHVIFCRNVMIYFDKETQATLVNRFAPHLAPGGYLLIGHSESLTGLQHPFDYVMPAVYRKRT